MSRTFLLNNKGRAIRIRVCVSCATLRTSGEPSDCTIQRMVDQPLRSMAGDGLRAGSESTDRYLAKNDPRSRYFSADVDG